ncbi:MAG: hypothetical protein V1885_01565 [Candidatus Brennerbacteria bacterium]
MQLTLLKADGHVVVWVDGQSVHVRQTWEEVFGELSRMLEDAIRTKERIAASFETTYGGREYLPPTADDIARARVQLSCFKGVLVEAQEVAEAPK